jgi:ATP-dependent Clp protease ATP-binding subunit ClpC
MPKINVYLPDDLAEAVRDSGLPVSAICQRALEQSLRRLTAIREATLTDLGGQTLGDRLPGFTARLVSTVTLAGERAEAAGAPAITTGDLLHGMLAEGGNLALQVLTAMDVAPASLQAPAKREPGSGSGGKDGLRFSGPAAIALEGAVGEAIGFGHNYVGCEHLLISLAAEPEGGAGELLRSRGADARAIRRAVAAAIAGYAHLRSSAATPSTSGLLTAVRAEIAPLVERIERLESRLSS